MMNSMIHVAFRIQNLVFRATPLIPTSMAYHNFEFLHLLISLDLYLSQVLMPLTCIGSFQSP